MNIIRDIQSLSVFKQNASKMIKQMRETKEPIILTVNGKPAVVVQDAESYQQLADSREYHETVVALRRAIEDIENADKWPTSDEVFANLRSKFGISAR